MKTSQYEDLVRRKGMAPIGRFTEQEYEVYMSEGFCRGDEDEVAPHYKTMFAFGSGEKVFLGEFFTTPILSGSSSEDRMTECTVRAIEQLSNFRESGCLK